jgi:Asp/Glu/hydantoin racemase
MTTIVAKKTTVVTTTGFPDYTKISTKELNEILSEIEEELKRINKEKIEPLKLEQNKAEAECKKRIDEMTN